MPPLSGIGGHLQRSPGAFQTTDSSRFLPYHSTLGVSVLVFQKAAGSHPPTTSPHPLERCSFRANTINPLWYAGRWA